MIGLAQTGQCVPGDTIRATLRFRWQGEFEAVNVELHRTEFGGAAYGNRIVLRSRDHRYVLEDGEPCASVELEGEVPDSVRPGTYVCKYVRCLVPGRGWVILFENVHDVVVRVRSGSFIASSAKEGAELLGLDVCGCRQPVPRRDRGSSGRPTALAAMAPAPGRAQKASTCGHQPRGRAAARRSGLGVNVGSFGARRIRDQKVADTVWTKVVFDEVDWDTDGGFDTDTGGFTAGRAAKFHFAAGVRFLAPDVPNRCLSLLLHKNGKPLEILTRDQAFNRPDSVALDSRETPWAEYVRGFTRGEVVARPGDVFEIYVRQEFGGPAYLTVRHPGLAAENVSDDRHPIYFMGLWHA